MNNITPLNDNVLVSENKKEVTSEAGIILEQARSVHDMTPAMVIAIGPEVTEVQVGDEVYLDWSKGNIVKHDGDEFVVVKEQHIIAVIEQE